eukprot:3219512-Ditylum_brightwellii.AAC.1
MVSLDFFSGFLAAKPLLKEVLAALVGAFLTRIFLGAAAFLATPMVAVPLFPRLAKGLEKASSWVLEAVFG